MKSICVGGNKRGKHFKDLWFEQAWQDPCQQWETNWWYEYCYRSISDRSMISFHVTLMDHGAKWMCHTTWGKIYQTQHGRLRINIWRWWGSGQEECSHSCLKMLVVLVCKRHLHQYICTCMHKIKSYANHIKYFIICDHVSCSWWPNSTNIYTCLVHQLKTFSWL